MKSSGYLKEFYKECLQEEGKRDRGKKKETGIARCRLKACPSYDLIILCI